MINLDQLKPSSKTLGVLSTCIFLAVSTINQQPGSLAIFSFIALSIALGKIDFEVKINETRLFSVMAIMSILSATSINFLNIIYWGLGEIVLNSFAIAILTKSYKRDEE